MDADAWNERYEARDLLWSVEPNRFLPAQVAGLAPGTALDLACGEGRNALWLAERGWHVTGVDFSDVAIGRGRGFAAERGVEVDWVVADVTTWDPPRLYDLVIVFYLQLPRGERTRVLRTAAGAVAADGSVLAVAHALRNLTDGAGGPQDPAVLYEVSDVTDVLGDGFDVVTAGEVVRPFEADEVVRDAVDVLVRARRRPSGGARGGLG